MKILGRSRLDTSSHKPHAAPVTQIEQVVADIWRSVLEVPSVGRRETFFDFGGNSVKLARVAARLRDVFGVDAPLAALLEIPTVEGMAAYVERVTNEVGRAPLPPITRHDGEWVPLSPAQERMWFFHQLDVEGTAYNVTNVMRLEGEVSTSALEQALQVILERHEPLRTTFETRDDILVGVVNPPDFTLPIVTFPDDSLPNVESAAMRHVLDTVRRPFDLERGPVFRAVLYRLQPAVHWLLVDMPHINSDAWSLSVLAEELGALYSAFEEGRPAKLAPLPVRYADFAAWQRSWLNDDVVADLRAYWERKLQDLPQLELPLDRPRPPRMTFRGAREVMPLDPELLQRLQRLGAHENASLFMTLLAAFDVLLHRWVGATDIVIGTPIAGRHHTQLEHLIGVFVNTLVLRTDLSNRPAFREVLRRVRATALEAFAHQDLPFAQLVTYLQPVRDHSRPPIAQVMFNHINVPMTASRIGRLKATPIEFDREGAQADFMCLIVESNDGAHAVFEYNTSVFEPATIRRLLRSYLTLLEDVASKPDERIDALSWIDDETRTAMRAFSCGPHLTVPKRLVHEVFEDQAHETPDAPAVFFEGRRTSYHELNVAADRVARRLRQLGIAPEEPVGVDISRSPLAITALLGVLKAGGAYVPLDPSYPAERLAFIFSDSGARIVLTTATSAATWSAGEAVTRVNIDELEPSMEVRPQEGAEAADVQRRIAYVMYTSGSTGRPKGVRGTHAGIMNRLAWMWNATPWEPGEIVAHKTSLSFVDSVWEMFGALCRGVPVVVVPDGVVQNPDAFVDALEQGQVTRVVVVPSLLNSLLDVNDAARRLRGVRWWTVSGEALSAALAQRFYKVLPDARLLNLYGSTEVAGDATWHEVPADGRDSFVAIGRPIANTKAIVVDTYGQPVPPGVPGELVIGGPNVAAGYHDRPALTAERFFDLEPSLPAFRTGDRAAWLADGSLRYLGRDDAQVKVRGVRVEPGEVEAALLGHPDVRACLVDTSVDSSGHVQLVAFLAAPAAFDTANLRSFLARSLPSSAIPSQFVRVDALPLNPNGKVDRARLSALAVSEASTPLHEVRTHLEEHIVRIWREVLSVQDVRLTSDFFELGGHSLLAARMLALVNDRFDVRVPLAAFFQHPTVSALATLVEGNGPAWRTLVNLQAQGALTPLFCVHSNSGHVVRLVPLARAFSPHRPVYAFQGRGLDGKEAPFESIEQMAAHYVAQAQQVQAQGPYFLAGYSLGGVVAFEMAQQLKAMGEEVGLLVLLDSIAPKPSAPSRWFGAQTVARRFQAEANLMVRSPDQFSSLMRERVHKGVRLLQARTRVDVEPETEEQALTRRMQRAHKDAFLKYRASSYDGPTLLIRARDNLLPPIFRWEEVGLEKLDVTWVDGDHVTMMEEPLVRHVASKLDAALREAEQDCLGGRLVH